MARQRIKPRILVVEDEPTVVALLHAALEADGLAVGTAADAAGGLEAALRGHFDLVLLDVSLPDSSGLDVCRRLRQTGSDVPVVFLTSRSDPLEKVRGFEVGGDDYVTKPFHARELVARIRAILRRSGAATESSVRVGDVEVALRARRIWRGADEVHLTPTEFEILRQLILRPYEVVARSELLAGIWHGVHVTPRTVDTHVANLRRKLGTAVIQTVHGVGYRLRIAWSEDCEPP